MKRWIGSLALALVAGTALAQAPFTIVRPADGAHVRETVHILIPKGSIPENGYIGIFLDGKFIEAVRPPVVGKYFQYNLDTKARGIADSEPGKPYKLETVLFTEYNDQPRIVDRSSVDLYVANKSSIQIPNDGFSLRYNWKPGSELIYRVTEKVVRDAISETQEKLGGRPAELDNVVPLSTRLMYAIDRRFPDANGKTNSDSDGLVRIQVIPEKGKDYVIVPVNGADVATKHFDVELAPIYMRLSTTGHQVWGSVPVLSNSELVGGRSISESLFADLPLPSLPARNVRPGDSWRSRFQEGTEDLLNRIGKSDSLVETYPARGEFIGVEWEMGHPCAVIKNTIAASESSAEAKALQAKTPGIQPRKIKEEETIWFSLDTRLMLKLERNIEIETTGSNAAYGFTSGGGSSAGGPQGGGGGFGGGFPGAGRRGPAGGGGGGLGGGQDGGGGDDFHAPMAIGQRRPGGFGGGGRGPAGGGGGQMPPGFGNTFPGQAPGTNGNAIVRLVVTETRVLEQ
jgi:hypothetical protein